MIVLKQQDQTSVEFVDGVVKIVQRDCFAEESIIYLTSPEACTVLAHAIESISNAFEGAE